MDSYLQTPSGQAQRRKAGNPARVAAQPTSQTVGYRVSSDDLKTGLEVRTINFSALPLDEVAELVRMRRLWDGAELPAQAKLG